MAATLLVQADLTPLFDNLYDFVQAAWEIGRRARKLQTAPTDADAYTLFTTPVATREANIQAVEDYCAELGSLTERKCLQCGRPPVQRPHEEPVLEIKHMWERSGAGKR